MNNSRLSVIIFFLVLLCFYFLFLGLLGKGGYYYNRSLEQIISVLEDRKEYLDTNLSNLRIYSQTLYNNDIIRDKAKQLGYIVEGDYIYLFSNSDLQPSQNTENNVFTDLVPYKPFSYFACFGLALIPAVLFSVTYFLINKKKKVKEQTLHL